MSELPLILLTALGRVVITCAIVWVLVWLLRTWLMRFVRRTRTSADDVLVPLVLETIGPLGYLGALLWGWNTLQGAARKVLGLGEWADRVVEGGVVLVAIVLMVRLINRSLLWVLERSLQKLGKEGKIAMLRALTPMIRSVVWILGALVFLQNQGVALGAIYASLAGAGIGIGLALKGPIANFINYLTILFDQPFEIGQVIRFNDVVAFVEQVGVRSSNLRSIDGELIVISNEDLLSQTIRNYGDFPRRRLLHRIGVVYRTPADQVEAIPGLIRELIEATPPLEFDRSHFIGFGDSSLDFEFSYYVPGGDLKEAYDLQQKVNLGILRRFEQEGIEFAFPTRTLYLEKGEPATEAQGVATAAGTLALPGR
ncbi:MAG: mechanosensitive ion channel family protein [Synechococcaceae cyanobacterium]|nr:mechanosensitive ion channel family protein [Synechococcaceae cyanobacterium]